MCAGLILLHNDAKCSDQFSGKTTGARGLKVGSAQHNSW